MDDLGGIYVSTFFVPRLAYRIRTHQDVSTKPKVQVLRA